jgi:hypothetical protein
MATPTLQKTPNSTGMGVAWYAWFVKLWTRVKDVWSSGTTVARPTDPFLGQLYFDTTLGYLVMAVAVKTGTTAAVWEPAPSASSPRKNWIINGGCQVNQRPATAAVFGVRTYGSVDRFSTNIQTGSLTAGTITQTTTSTAGRTGFAYHLSGLSTGASTTMTVNTFIESKDAIQLKNKQGSLSVVVWQDTGSTLTYALNIYSRGAVDGGAPTLITTSNTSVPTSTVTTCKLENITLGDTTNGLQIQVSSTIGAVTTKNFHFTEWQLTEGNTCQPFSYVSFEDELARCQRYYQKSFAYATAPAQNIGINTSGVYIYIGRVAGVAGAEVCPLNLPVVMRVSPTATFYNPAANNALWRNVSLPADSGAAALAFTGEMVLQVVNPQVAGDAVNNQYQVHYTLNADM